MRVRIALIGAAALAALVFPSGEAEAHTDIAIVGTQFVPAVAQVEVGHSFAFMNMEPADYPIVNGEHNVAPDHEVGHLADVEVFPGTSPDLAPGDSWECEPNTGTGNPNDYTCPAASGSGSQTIDLPPGTYAYYCEVHPNTQHALLVVS